ncbi:MAG: PEP-CTERM sorting domain-containing protein, partial [Sphingomonadales bacterium]
TLDGVNCCTDTLTVALNGVTLLNGSYGLGGGGSDVTNTQAAGSTLNVNNGARTIDFSSAMTLLNGANVLSFSYAGAPQGLGDEAWGINSAVVSGNAFAAVPEPSVWALLILGFGLVGGALRSQRKARVALSYS